MIHDFDFDWIPYLQIRLSALGLALPLSRIHYAPRKKQRKKKGREQRAHGPTNAVFFFSGKVAREVPRPLWADVADLAGPGRQQCSLLLLISFLCVRDVGADFCRTDELRWLTRPTSSGSSTYTSSGLAHIRLNIRRGSEPTTSLKSRHCFVKTSFFFTLHAFNSIRR